MNKPIFDFQNAKPSPYPDNFIPAGARIFIGVDCGSADGDCTVKGFYINGEYHIQSIETCRKETNQ